MVLLAFCFYFIIFCYFVIFYFLQMSLPLELVQNALNIFLTFRYWQVIDEFDENVHFVEIDIEEDPEVAEAAGIMGTPCVQFFKNKEMLRLTIS